MREKVYVGRPLWPGLLLWKGSMLVGADVVGRPARSAKFEVDPFGPAAAKGWCGAEIGWRSMRPTTFWIFTAGFVGVEGMYLTRKEAD